MVYPAQIKDFNQALTRSNILFHNPRGSIPDHFLVLQRSPVIDVASFHHIFLPECLGPSFQEKWEGWEISQQSEWKNSMKHDVFAKEISLVMLNEKNDWVKWFCWTEKKRKNTWLTIKFGVTALTQRDRVREIVLCPVYIREMWYYDRSHPY